MGSGERGSGAARWMVLVPVKSTSVGKSRIAVPAPRRARLARAMALDTVAAVAAATRVGGVLVLADDEEDGRELGKISGVRAHLTGVRGLNESIREAQVLLASAGSTGPLAVLPADLPSLRPCELDAALAAADGLPLAVVADRQGLGSTMLAARAPAMLRPRYGPGSFAAHLAAGAVPLAVPAESGLRCDVDVIGDLRGVTGSLTCAEARDLVTDAARR